MEPRTENPPASRPCGAGRPEPFSVGEPPQGPAPLSPDTPGVMSRRRGKGGPVTYLNQLSHGLSWEHRRIPWADPGFSGGREAPGRGGGRSAHPRPRRSALLPTGPPTPRLHGRRPDSSVDTVVQTRSQVFPGGPAGCGAAHLWEGGAGGPSEAAAIVPVADGRGAYTLAHTHTPVAVRELFGVNLVGKGRI